MALALPFSILLLFIFLTISATISTLTPPAYSATDLILLNCGESAELPDTANRSWKGDARLRYAPSNAAAISSAYPAAYNHPSVFPVPYKTARVFTSPFTYTFPVSSGKKFLRLHFYPDVYSTFNTSLSLFSVTANEFTLFTNFSAYLYSKNTSRFSFIREFVVGVGENQRIDLTFSPNPNSFAFVNGIEIVSIPDTLYFRGGFIPFGHGVYDLKDNTALENLYRLNVGGASVDIQDDSGPTRGMFRAWTPDDDYIYGSFDYGYTPHLEDVQIKYSHGTPPYNAPAIVYTSARVMGNTSISLDWEFPVDSGFYYLLRLHFCEFTREVRGQNQRVFGININNQTEVSQFDVIMAAAGPDTPILRDFVVWVSDDGRRGRKILRLSIYPSAGVNSEYKSAVLNGLEMFKLSDEKASLAAANPELMEAAPPTPVTQKKKKRGGSSVIYAAIGSVIGALAVVGIVSFLIFLVTNSSWIPISTGSRSTDRTNGSGGSLPSNLCRYFSLDEIKTATRNFDTNFIIGRGGFGNVYKGLIDNATTTVAIKRLNPYSNQGAREFLTEIEMLSKLRHIHLVSLIGYCDDNGEMILVYDFMAHGTLRDHLYKTENSTLTWKQRIQICLEAARGLDYLHTGTKNSIIHRDVKSSNILVDEKWVAKMSDFGLSKVGPAAGIHTHISTVVKGSFGYIDPEYYRRKQLTDKSDVYSFGVVLFEILCARPAVNASLPREQANLAEWAKLCFRKGTLDQIIDPNLKGQISKECLSIYVETAIACLKDKGIDRPTMNNVVWRLEFAMKLQESAGSMDGGSDGLVITSPSLSLLGNSEETSTSSEFSTSSSERLKSAGEVFSDIRNPLGR